MVVFCVIAESEPLFKQDSLVGVTVRTKGASCENAIEDHKTQIIMKIGVFIEGFFIGLIANFYIATHPNVHFKL